MASEYPMNGGSPPGYHRLQASPALQLGIPSPDDLTGWKEADRRLIERFAQHLESDPRMLSARPVKRYFSRDDWEHFFQTHRLRGVVAAYTAWAILDYRPTCNSLTRAQKMLAVGLPEPEAILLRARMATHPSIWRIVGNDPRAGTVDLEDTLLGGKATLHDRLFSQNLGDIAFMVARIFPAGNFHFMEIAGPPLGAAMGMDAVAYLRDCRVTFTPQGLQLAAHAFGWLWDWVDQWQANWKMPRLCNTDGDDLLFHTASFSIEDTESVRGALEKRADIDFDEGAGEYVWSRQTGDESMMTGDNVTLGRIELVGDELVLTVNSARRLATARKWLEELPGVRFRDFTTRRIDELEQERPLDERLAKPAPVEMTPQLAAAVQASLNKTYMQWLDRPLPILAGKTPRQACCIPEGRQQVAMMIRTMPNPVGPVPIQIPRQAMLRELGLEVEPASRSTAPTRPFPASAPDAARAASGKVGRNDPCPCGSGKKYKKCCGG